MTDFSKLEKHLIISGLDYLSGVIAAEDEATESEGRVPIISVRFYEQTIDVIRAKLEE